VETIMTEYKIPFDRECTALLLVDLQRDFMPGGALAVGQGDAIIAPIRQLLERDLFGLYAATQDWHPPGHASFASVHAGREPFELIELQGKPQMLWPDHCVQNSSGAALHDGLNWNQVAVIVRKGMQQDVDSYSGFRNNWNAKGERPATGLAGYLREHGHGVTRSGGRAGATESTGYTGSGECRLCTGPGTGLGADTLAGRGVLQCGPALKTCL
jgi:nicotinamidase-related amidase